MIELIQAIQNKLSTNNSIQYVDENWGQLNIPDFTIMWPCVLIDIATADFSNTGKDNSKTPINGQIGNVVVELRIANQRLTDTPEIPTVSVWEIAEQVHLELHGWNPTETTSKLIRQSVNSIQRNDGVQECAVKYLIGENC